MRGGHTLSMPDSGHVAMLNRSPLLSSSRYCLVCGPNEDHMEMMAWAFME